jgi:uncharacterized membrane protein HdeD (DUF308 family)
MSTTAAIIALVLGVLILTFWAVNILLTILGWGLIIVGAIVLIQYLVGKRKRSDL